MQDDQSFVAKQAETAFTGPKGQERSAAWIDLAAEEKARAKKTATLCELRLAKQKAEIEEPAKVQPMKLRQGKVR
jgi:hypothetical protein